MKAQKNKWIGIQYFKPSEFTCKCGCGFLPYNIITHQFISDLDYARDLARVPFIVNSGCRCEKHNTAIGGERDSAHCKGLAADIQCKTPRRRTAILEALLTVGFNRIVIYDNFIHVDNDTTKMPGTYIARRAEGSL
jgi:hypothetical protein